MRQQLLYRVRDRLTSVISRDPIDFKYLHLVCTQELQFIRAGAAYLDVPGSVLDHVQQLSEVVRNHLSHSTILPLFDDVAAVEWSGSVGRPRLTIDRQTLLNLLGTELPLTSLANLHGISRSTLYRRMQEHNLSVREGYSDIPDHILELKVRSVKARLPHAGHRLVKGSFRSMGSMEKSKKFFAACGWCRSSSSNGPAVLHCKTDILRSCSSVTCPHRHKSQVDPVCFCLLNFF